jgi:hypothetical protein
VCALALTLVPALHAAPHVGGRLSLALQDENPPAPAPLSPDPLPAPQQENDTTQPEATAPTDQPARPASNTQLEDVILELISGQQVEGLLVRRDAQQVVLRIGNIDKSYDLRDVSRIIVLPSVQERYGQLRRNIPDDDIEQLIVLIRWLHSRNEYGLALLEVEHVISLEDGHPEANRLKKRLEAELLLRNSRGEGEPREVIERREEFPTLSPEEINLMKVYEVDLTRPPAMELQRGAIDRLVERYGDHELMPQTPEGIEALRRWPAHRVLELMFRMRARDMYSQVLITGYPEAIRRFRDDVHGSWLSRSCATNRCHGGTEAGRLMLRNVAKGADATVFTNLLILDRFRLPDGTPLIDYEQPERSPLLQMAVDPKKSTFQHPPLPKETGVWRAPISGPEDPYYKDAIDWIRSMYAPRPEYPIEYTPPRTKADELPEEILMPAPGGPR